MKIHGNQLAQQLDKALPAAFWISGDEPLLSQEAADSVRACCQYQGFQEREIWYVDNAMAWDDLLLSANSLSLFAQRKLIELRFSSAKPGEKAIKALGHYLANPNPDCLLLVTSPKLDAAAMRSKGFKQLEARMLLVQIWPVDIDKLPDWIAARLRTQGFRVEREALQMLADRVQGNLLAAQQEIDKLVLLADGTSIDTASVMHAVADSARYDVFGLTEQMLKGDALAVQRMLAGLRAEGTDATVVLWAIAREVRMLLALQRAVARGQSIDAAMQQQRIFPKRQGLVKQACKRLDQTRLLRALRQAKEVDYAIKGLAKTSPWNGLSSLALLLAGHRIFPTQTSIAG